MAYNFFSEPSQELPKIRQTLPKIRVKSDIPAISLQDDNLFFNIDGNDYSMDYVAGEVSGLFFND